MSSRTAMYTTAPITVQSKVVDILLENGRISKIVPIATEATLYPAMLRHGIMTFIIRLTIIIKIINVIKRIIVLIVTVVNAAISGC